MKNNKQKALQWWGLLKSSEKLSLWYKYRELHFTASHSPDYLTEREIESIFNAEIKS